MARVLNPVSAELPHWAGRLANYYWRIRNESRDKAKRRRYYRYIKKEQIRLAESGIDQALLKAVSRHLSVMTAVSARKVEQMLEAPNPQMTFQFDD